MANDRYTDILSNSSLPAVVSIHLKKYLQLLNRNSHLLSQYAFVRIEHHSSAFIYVIEYPEDVLLLRMYVLRVPTSVFWRWSRSYLRPK
jgi:hypothetical protein